MGVSWISAQVRVKSQAALASPNPKPMVVAQGDPGSAPKPLAYLGRATLFPSPGSAGTAAVKALGAAQKARAGT